MTLNPSGLEGFADPRMRKALGPRHLHLFFAIALAVLASIENGHSEAKSTSSYCNKSRSALVPGDSVLYKGQPAIFIGSKGDQAVIEFPSTEDKSSSVDISDLTKDPKHQVLEASPFRISQPFSRVEILPKAPLGPPPVNKFIHFADGETVYDYVGNSFRERMVVLDDKFNAGSLRTLLKDDNEKTYPRHAVLLKRKPVNSGEVSRELEARNISPSQKIYFNQQEDHPFKSLANIRFETYDPISGEVTVSTEDVVFFPSNRQEIGKIQRVSGDQDSRKWQTIIADEFGLGIVGAREKSIHTMSWAHFLSLNPKARNDQLKRNQPKFISGKVQGNKMTLKWDRDEYYENALLGQHNGTVSNRLSTYFKRKNFSVYSVLGPDGQKISEFWFPKAHLNSKGGKDMMTAAKVLLAMTPPEIVSINQQVILSPNKDQRSRGLAFSLHQSTPRTRTIWLNSNPEISLSSLLDTYYHETGHSLAKLIGNEKITNPPTKYKEAVLLSPQSPSGYVLKEDERLSVERFPNRSMNAGVERFADAFAIYASIEFGQPGKDFDNFVEMLDPQFAFFDEIVIELQNNPLTETPPEYFQNLYR